MGVDRSRITVDKKAERRMVIIQSKPYGNAAAKVR